MHTESIINQYRENSEKYRVHGRARAAEPRKLDASEARAYELSQKTNVFRLHYIINFWWKKIIIYLSDVGNTSTQTLITKVHVVLIKPTKRQVIAITRV